MILLFSDSAVLLGGMLLTLLAAQLFFMGRTDRYHYRRVDEHYLPPYYNVPPIPDRRLERLYREEEQMAIGRFIVILVVLFAIAAILMHNN